MVREIKDCLGNNFVFYLMIFSEFLCPLQLMFIASYSIILTSHLISWLFMNFPFLYQLFPADGSNLYCSFPALSCEFASVDVSDVLGTVSFYYSF